MYEYFCRGKLKNSAQWVYGYAVRSTESPAISPLYIYSGECYEVDPMTIGRSTGKSDKKGRPIFEGDVVRDYLGSVSAVVWISTDSYCGFQLCPVVGKPFSKVEDPWRSLLIIGNIHDNTDFLVEEGV